MKYARLFSQKIGYLFTNTSIRLTAMTGAAATEIGGRTTCHDFKYLRKSNEASAHDIDSFRDTRLSIIDEISFANYQRVLNNIAKNLQGFTECYEHLYRKHAIAFLGNFCQLEPIGGDAIYTHKDGSLWEQSLNCMVELKGVHRYKDCEVMKRIMPTLREKGISEEDRKILNTRVVGTVTNGEELKMPNPTDVRYATWTNMKRAEINAEVFKAYLESNHKDATHDNIPTSAIIIKSNAFWGGSKKRLSFDQRKTLFEQCSEDDCKTKDNIRIDPFMCLHYNCEIMNTENEDVDKGKAKGTTSHLEKVWLKRGAKLQPMRVYGFWVYAVDVQDVDHLELRWHSMDRFQGTFKEYPKTALCHVDFPVTFMGEKMNLKDTPMRIQQFPVVLNHATTCHKLQGKSLDALVVAEWAAIRNWAYVVISRVRTLDGLYLLKPIPENVDFKPDEEYLAMMKRLRSRISAMAEQVENLRRIIQKQINEIREANK